MLDLCSAFKTRRRDGLSRRAFVRAGSLPFFGLTLADLFEARSEETGTSKDNLSCILLWCDGGISTIDTFDMKPDAPIEFRGEFPRDNVGALSTEMVEHFFRSLAESLGAALQIGVTGRNTHHMIEACFKSVGRALRQAIRQDGSELPSTKGVLA